LDWELARELASSGKLKGSDLRPLYLDDEALVYARPTEGTLEHIEPLKEPEDYAPDVLALATEELFDHVERHGPSKRVLSLLGRLLILEGREEEALEIHEAANRLSPDDLDTLTELSWLYDRKRMYSLAERSARRALELGGNDELTHILARALYGQGRFEEAAGWFEGVIAKDQGNLAALRAIVDAYQRLDRTDLALRHRQRLAVVEESTIERLLTEAEQKRREPDFLGAADTYQRAHEIRPSDTTILWDRVVVLLADGRTGPAVDTLRKMVEQDPAHGLAHLMLGSLCAREVECAPEEARQHLETFLELQPDDINAEIARRELAALARRSGGP
jgi:tetratricopeptide (TPR) repeat protein